MMTILPEFQQVDGKNAFVKNHPVPPFEKDMWKKTLTLPEQWGHYENAYKESLGLLKELNESLVELDALVYSSEYCTEGDEKESKGRELKDGYSLPPLFLPFFFSLSIYLSIYLSLFLSLYLTSLSPSLSHYLSHAFNFH